MFLLEQFKSCVHPSIKNYLTEQKANTLGKAAEMADEYFLSHKHLLQKGGSPQNTFQKTFYSSKKNNSATNTPHNETIGSKVFTRKSSTSDQETSSNDKMKVPVCNYCKRKGHVLSDCFILKRDKKVKEKDALPNALTTLKTEPKCFTPKHKVAKDKSSTSDFVQEVYEPFLSKGSISLMDDKTSTKPIKILRDTGASQSLLLADVIPLSEKTSSGQSVLIQGVECGLISVPLHHIDLQSDLVSGPVTVGVRSSLPIEGVHLILGNDLAGDKVVVNPVVTEKPEVGAVIDPIEEEIPDLYPSCAVTRAMARKATRSEAPERKCSNSDFTYDLTDTFLTSLYDESDQHRSEAQIASSKQKSLPRSNTAQVPEKQGACTKAALTQDKDSNEPSVHIPSDDDKSQDFSTKKLILEQQKDSSLSSLLENVIPEDEISSVPCCYYKKNGVLMRKWRPPDAPVDAEWTVKHQIVLPKPYRKEVLMMAHETPLAGHLGVSKTYNKILNHFFWPLLKTDVSNYCRSCHTCQMVGKPNQKIPHAPLHPIPAFEEPFSRIIVDCVGPLPKTRSGNEFLLTIMCASTRFPEAIPLRNIKAKTIVKALVKFFTFVGLPKSIQSDQGSNFMSGLFQQVMYELKIKQYKSSAYHPESQGALERFHQTLKNMIRTYCYDTEKDWDEGIHLLLFAARESVQESLGFSPFELVFGHSVRGPLKFMKEKLLSDEEAPLNLLNYVSDFKLKLSNACELAQKNLRSSQAKMKTRYDQNTTERNFEEGDQVLALLPIPGRPLQARYFGPYTVIKKVSEVNYIVSTPGRRKSQQLCHINMLKKYVDRHSSTTRSIGAVTNISSEDDEENCEFGDSTERIIDPDVRINYDSKILGSQGLQNSDILADLDSKLNHLGHSEREQLKTLILDYKHLFPDVPSRTNKIFHDVDIGNSQPVKQHPYRMNPVKQQYLKEEVNYLLENDFIEPSKSDWSSPCILVPKPDGTYRMCTDYRKVNSATKTDSFPIPRIDDCIDKIGRSKYVTKFDLLKGFWQIPLTDRAKEISAFVTPDGLFQYKVMPFGMKNSPATFQRLINNLIAGMDGIGAYIDDVIIYSDSWSDHLRTIQEFFDRLTEYRLTVNLVKSEFCHGTLTFLGHIVGQGQVKPVSAKVQSISDFPAPTNKKQLMRFLGMAGYYRKFCSNFSTVSAPLTNLLKKNVKFVWTDCCQEALDKLKAILKSEPVLAAPNFLKPFKLAVDASDVGAGAVLLQEDRNGVDHPICYFSKKFNKHQKNYSTIEKECLSLVISIQHFEVYISSVSSPVTVYTDHNPLTFLKKMRNKNQRLLRWALLLQEYNLDIRHVKGKENVVADALSRSI